MPTVKGMLAGMQTKGSGDGSNPLDNLEKLTTIVKNMMPPPAPAGGMGAGEVFGIVRDVMNLSKEMAPEGGGEGTPWGMIIDKAVEHGTMPPPDAPWGDPRFQKMLVQALHDGGLCREDAKKLAVVKEVFGK